MLSKLMKYELKATGRVFLPLYLALLVFALINRFMMGVSASQQWEAPVVISMAIYVIIMVGMFVMTLIMTIQRFYKNLLSEEGYLMFTLPVKPWQHIICKMLISMFWIVLSFIIAMLSILTIAYRGGDWARMMQDAGPFLQEVIDFLGATLYVYSVEALIGIFLSLASAILILYASIAIGHLFTQHRILASFAAFIGLNTLTQIITTAITALGGYDYFDTFEVNAANFHSVQAELQTFILIFLVLSALVSVAYFAIANWILGKRLNLE